jgi:hypothetical protein
MVLANSFAVENVTLRFGLIEIFNAEVALLVTLDDAVAFLRRSTRLLQPPSAAERY